MLRLTIILYGKSLMIGLNVRFLYSRLRKAFKFKFAVVIYGHSLRFIVVF